MTDTIIPVAYALPLTGKFAIFLFLPFSAWFAGISLEPQQYGMLIFSGVLSLFGSMTSTVQFLLGQLGLPAESINVFLATGSLVSNIYGLIEPATMGMFSVVAGAAVLGLARFHVRKAVMYGAVALVVVLVGTAGMTVLLRPFGNTGTSSYDTLQRMRVEPSVEGVVYTSAAEAPAPQAPGADSVLTRVQKSRRAARRLRAHRLPLLLLQQGARPRRLRRAARVQPRRHAELRACAVHPGRPPVLRRGTSRRASWTSSWAR